MCVLHVEDPMFILNQSEYFEYEIGTNLNSRCTVVTIMKNKKGSTGYMYEILQ